MKALVSVLLLSLFLTSCNEDTGQIFFEKDGLDPISKKGDQAAPSPAAGPDNTSGPSENDSSPNIDEDKKDEIVKDNKDDKDDNKPKSPVIVVPPMPEPTPMPAPMPGPIGEENDDEGNNDNEGNNSGDSNDSDNQDSGDQNSDDQTNDDQNSGEEGNDNQQGEDQNTGDQNTGDQGSDDQPGEDQNTGGNEGDQTGSENEDESEILEIEDLIVIEEDKNVSCSPLSEKNNSEQKGIVGNVRVIKKGLKKYNSLRNKLTNYLNPEYSEELPIKVFMENINVPERKFSKGFKTNAQTILRHDDRDLIEWFNVNLESELMLTGPEEEGHYELMIVSDDGSALSIKEMGGEFEHKNFLYSPNKHGPKAVCHKTNNSSALINFKYGKKYKLNINYFQGPRHVIALQMFWRKIPEANVEKFKRASLCNSSMYIRSGRDRKLDKDGFKLIEPKYFNLPGSSVNQCGSVILDTFKLSKHPSDISKIKIFIDGVEYLSGFQTLVDTDKDEVSIKLNQGITQYQRHEVKIVYPSEKEEEQETP